ncbi:MAG: hypothetical protein OEU32_05620 [Acidimicrobiia bacterium]|nr:hypothetical protein [Acidimicrobiia bacterium]
MLTPYDDYPIHQTPLPIAHPATAAADHYDRYFFNGHDADAGVFFAAAMGHYPNRGVIDAAFSVIVDGVQHSVFASGRMPLDRSTDVGPIEVEVLEPLRSLRIAVDDNDTGLTADVVFDARTAAIEEPRQSIDRDGVLVMDYTRLTQWGNWTGTISVAGQTLAVEPATFAGTRDRSWGVRPVGEPAPANHPPRLPALFWLWAPLHFAEHCTHLALFEHANGDRWMQSGLDVPVLAPGRPTHGPDAAPATTMDTADYDLRWKPGTREVEHAAIALASHEGMTRAIDLEPLFTFRMRGVGYTHPHFKHGSNHGELEVGGESLVLADIDPLDPSSIHIQTVCRAHLGAEVGVGILEQLAFGPHDPTGLTGIVDGYAPHGEPEG